MASDEPSSNGPQPEGNRRIFLVLDAAVILASVAVLCVRAQDQPLSQTALSRLATVVALTESGTWYIDTPPESPRNAFEARTIDKVQVEGRLLSSKPPLMPWLMAQEYRALRAAFGWTLDNLSDTKRVLYAYTLTFSIVPWTLALMAACALLRSRVASAAGRSLALAALAFGTQVFGFASVFNNHVPAAAALVIAAWLVLSYCLQAEARPGVAAVAGLLGGLVAAVDVPNAAYVAGLWLALVVRGRNWNWTAFAGAAALPVLMQSGFLYASTGSPLPVQLHPGTYLYESSYWRNPVGVDALSEPKGIYLFNMTFGTQGIFVLYPILLAGIAGTVLAAIRRVPLRSYVLGAAVCFAVVLGYYAASTSNYGGEVYGMRWLIPSMPVLVFMGIPVWSSMNRRAVLTAGILALGVSAYSAWQCGSNPWTAGQEWPRTFWGE